MIKPGLRDLLWMASGGAALLAVSWAVLHFRDEQVPAEQVAFKARRLELVDRMSGTLALASEAEKNAVLATTDDDSRAFADQARTDTAAVEQARDELDALLQARGTASERDLLGRFSRAFDELRRIDEELLGLAVENSNIKAYGLAYGPAAKAVAELADALSKLAATRPDGEDDPQVMRLAFGAEIAALRIQSLLPPHIAEESDEAMDRMETAMAEQEQSVQADLDGLRALPELASSADLEAAASAWARFRELQAQILSLSRENSDVRSLALSLNGKRKLMLASQAALASLRNEIGEEPIPGVTEGHPISPR